MSGAGDAEGTLSTSKRGTALHVASEGARDCGVMHGRKVKKGPCRIDGGRWRSW